MCPCGKALKCSWKKCLIMTGLVRASSLGLVIRGYILRGTCSSFESHQQKCGLNAAPWVAVLFPASHVLCMSSMLRHAHLVYTLERNGGQHWLVSQKFTWNMMSLLLNVQRFTFFGFLVLRFSATNMLFSTVRTSLVVSVLQTNIPRFGVVFWKGKHNFTQLSVKSRIAQLPFCCSWHSF